MSASRADRSPTRQRVLSGMQPSGLLHLGNLLGALENWKALQDQYECFFFVADWHALSTNYADTSRVREYTREMLMDWLAAGIDPRRATVFVQSRVPEHAILHLLLSMVIPVPWLERVPTYKEKQEELSERDLTTYGFLGYPVLQAADILIYKADYVPVGKDQLPHLELTREIARRFNHLFGPVFPEPEARLTEIPKVPGTDGRKMSKSYDNCIYLADPPEVITPRIKTMMTDPARKRRQDPGNPEVCPVFDLHKIFTPEDDREYCATGCRTAGIGCLDCKGVLLAHLLPRLEKIRERRGAFARRPGEIDEILREGSRTARQVARATLDEAKAAVGIG